MLTSVVAENTNSFFWSSNIYHVYIYLVTRSWSDRFFIWNCCTYLRQYEKFEKSNWSKSRVFWHWMIWKGLLTRKWLRGPQNFTVPPISSTQHWLQEFGH
jgi:hypothetical protein